MFAPILSWLHFDDYAERATHNIWNAFILARHQDRRQDTFIEAVFPFREVAIEAIGYEISSVEGVSKILVTRIPRLRLPDGPSIHWAHAFGRGPADMEIESDEEFKFSGRRLREGEVDDTIAADLDAAPSGNRVEFLARATKFENCDMLQQKRKLLTHYKKAEPIPAPDENPTEWSTGEDRSQGGGKASGQQQPRDLEHGFKEIGGALGELQVQGVISNIHILGPADPSRLIQNAELDLWNFSPYPQAIEDPHGNAERFSRYLKRETDSNARRRVRRAALAVGYEIDGHAGYLIEIGGAVHDSFLAGVVWGVGDLAQNVIEDTLDIMAVYRGYGWGRMLKWFMAEKYGARASTVKHYSVNGALSLKAFAAALRPSVSTGE
jgi:hypothetical protein